VHVRKAALGPMLFEISVFLSGVKVISNIEWAIRKFRLALIV